MITGLCTFIVFNGFIGWFIKYAWDSVDEFQVAFVLAILAVAIILNVMIVRQYELRNLRDFFIAYRRAFFG